MTEPANILEFSNVTLPGAARGQVEMRNVTFQIPPGRLLLIKVEAGNESLPISDAAEGLIAPKTGFIRWQGKEWNSLGPLAELDARARIGRVFEKNSWISNLNVNEYVTLSQRHHTERTERDILTEADALAGYFGLPETPRQRPAFVPKRELKMAEWIRALIGKPLLLLLERPEAGVPDDNLPKSIDAVHTALRRGAAAIWQTDRNAVWSASIWTNEIRYRMQGAEMLLVEDK
jgi:ABC-type branched-subunit amino acid transport system ATPase component